MSSPLLYMALLLLGTGKSGAQSVSQSPEELSVSEGSPLFINCTYEVLGTPFLFWYFQRPGEAPQLLLQDLGEKEQRGFSAPHNKTNKSFHLRKESCEVGDSGLYLCALRDTGAGYKLIFGEGTRLRVKPDLRDSPPSVYRLKPAVDSENQTGSACLITDFFPSNQVKVFINKEKGQRTPTLVESGKRWSYGVVEWSSDPHDQPVNCAASYKERNNYTYEGKDDVQKSCPVMSVDESFQTDEKLNTLSLTVLGLKIIFMKSIAFNILMTVKLLTR